MLLRRCRANYRHQHACQGNRETQSDLGVPYSGEHAVGVPDVHGDAFYGGPHILLSKPVKLKTREGKVKNKIRLD